MKSAVLATALLLWGPVIHAQDHAHHHEDPVPPAHRHATGPADCGAMEVWDYSMAMCMPLPMADMPMSMVMLHGNAFAVQSARKSDRGRDAFAVPNMIMADVGTSVGDNHYVNLDLMATLEKWTFPKEGYPELLQIGESNEDELPFIDAQHPHSSPIMGLTLSDTISLGRGKDHVKIWFAPRGEATEGPIAFMHRPTGMVNPDAPLGHHIGQDVGHITSTVIGGALRLGETTIELSTFNGREPEPTKVDLPVGAPNSYAMRLTRQFGDHLYAMASASYVKEPEHHDPDLDHINRYSASIYGDKTYDSGWACHHAFIWGLVNGYDHASALNSFAMEFWMSREAANFFGRLEHLQRTPNELLVAASDPDDGRWVSALTLGYTHEIASWEGSSVGLGGSLTKDILPSEYRASYGDEALTGRLFLRVTGMRMWEL